MCLSRELSSRSLRLSVPAFLIALAAASAGAEPGFWALPSGPGGGAVMSLVRQTDGTLFAAMANDLLYRSDDGGYSWRALARPASHLAALDNGDLYDMKSYGLERSRDDGVTWTSLVGAPGNGQKLVATSTGELILATSAGVFRSANDGVSWEPTTITAATYALIVSEGNVYAGAGNQLLRSSDDGAQWTPLATIPNQVITAIEPRASGGWWIGTSRQTFMGGAGLLYTFEEGGTPEYVPVYLDNVLSIIARADGYVFVAASGDFYNESWGSLVRSPNDGASWSTCLDGGIVALVRSTGDGMYAATSGSAGHLGSYPGTGIWHSSGGGSVWSRASDGIPCATSCALATANGVMYAEAGFSLAMSTDHGATWRTSNGRFLLDTYGLRIAAHPSGDVFATSVPWVAAKSGGGSTASSDYACRSRDGGTTWTPLDVPAPTSLQVTAAGSVLATAWDGVLRSTDRGDTWNTESAGLTGEVMTILPGPVSRVFATTWDATYLSEDDGVNWRRIGGIGGEELAVIPAENRVYVQHNGTLNELNETGPAGDWSLHALPSPPAAGPMAVDATETLYLAALDGVWRKGPAELQWQAIPDTPSLASPGMSGRESILFDAAGFLYVGTGFHGVLRSRLPIGRANPTGVEPGITIAGWQPGPTPFRGSTAFGLELQQPAQVSLRLFDARGRIVSTLWDGADLGAGRHRARWEPGPAIASGSYFYRLVVGSSTRTGRVTLLR